MFHAIPLEARTFPYAVDTVVPLTAGSGEARAVNARGDIAGQVDGDAFIWYGGRLHRYRDSVYQVPTGTPLTIATAIDANGRGAGSVGTYLPCSMSGLELATAVRFFCHSRHDRSITELGRQQLTTKVMWSEQRRSI